MWGALLHSLGLNERHSYIEDSEDEVKIQSSKIREAHAEHDSDSPQFHDSGRKMTHLLTLPSSLP